MMKNAGGSSMNFLSSFFKSDNDILFLILLGIVLISFSGKNSVLGDLFENGPLLIVIVIFILLFLSGNGEKEIEIE
jgi:hypothetical protein